MKRVIGIIGSPRKLGNCELLVKEIAAKVPGGARLAMVRLPEKEIRTCRACYRCLAGDCPLEDDFRRVLEAVLSADGVVVAAPTYLRGAHSSLQRFLDRGLQFWRHVDALASKPAVAVAVAGVKDGEGHAMLGVVNAVRAMGMTLKDRAVVHAALPGEALLSEAGRAAAARLAGALFAPEGLPSTSPCCTVCGGTFFEFRGGDRIFCLLCGAGGTVAGSGAGTRIETRPPEQSWLGVGAMKAHGEWLVAMKERFLAERDRLKAAAAPYRGGDFL